MILGSDISERIDGAVLEYILNYTGIEVDSKAYRRLVLELRQTVADAIEKTISEWSVNKARIGVS